MMQMMPNVTSYDWNQFFVETAWRPEAVAMVSTQLIRRCRQRLEN
jgi:hypothetical protein